MIRRSTRSFIRPDQKPEVALLAPTADLDMPANGVDSPHHSGRPIPIFCCGRSCSRLKRKGDAFPDEKLFESELPRQFVRGSDYFAAQSTLRNLNAGDTIQFWIEVEGQQAADSQPLTRSSSH